MATTTTKRTTYATTYNGQPAVVVVCPPRTVRGAHTARAWRPLGRAAAACRASGKGLAPSR